MIKKNIISVVELFHPELCGQAGSTCSLCFGGSGMKCWPKDILSWFTFSFLCN